MKKEILLVALLMGATGVIPASAQRDNRHHEKNVVSAFSHEDTDHSKVEKIIKSNAPASPNDNGLPRFIIVGKDHQFYLGLGAQFLGEGVFDWGDDMPSPILMTPSSIVPSTPGNGASTRFAWQTSSIYMNFVALPGTHNQIGLFFKGNFKGANNTFHCHHFYARFRGLTAGYTTSPFTDASAESFTIDNEGPNGYPYLTLFTAYWKQNFTPDFSGAIGIDAPSASITTGTRTSTVNQRIPALPAYLQYAWDGGNSHIRLSGIIRPLQYRDLVRSENKTIVGTGVQLSGMAGLVGNLSVQYSGAYGSGIGNYLQDDTGIGLDAVPTAVDGTLKAVRSMGLTGGLSYSFSPKVSSNLVYSHLSNWFGENTALSDDTYRHGDYVVANIIYAVNKFVSAGIEYDYGNRRNISGSSLHTNRIQCQFAVTF
ncbi:MAG: hypothetical protein HDS15_04670 [Bacteroides sp.]|nr:hypothetical protein [Bacteroides sp.]